MSLEKDENKKTDFFIKYRWFIFLAAAILTFFTPYLLTRNWGKISFIGLGEVGDVIGGTTAPFLSFFGAILIYYTLQAQIKANGVIRNQFKQNQIDNSNDFEFNRFREKINLLINEVNSFTISFHGNKLIANIENVPSLEGKKYNFEGIQAINLFLLEYFRQKTESEQEGTKKFHKENSFLAVFLNVNNLITLFYKTHSNLQISELPESYKRELEDLLHYVYYSKLNYFIELYRKYDPLDKLELNIELFYNYYKIQK